MTGKLYRALERLKLRYEIRKIKTEIARSVIDISYHSFLGPETEHISDNEERDAKIYLSELDSLRKLRRRLLGEKIHLESLLDLSLQQSEKQKEREREAKIFAG